MDVKKLLADVTALPGVSGHEAQVSAYFAEQFRPLVDEVTVDAMYSVIARKKGKGPKIMLCAHLDEIALMVTHIEDDGSLRLGNVGGVDPRILPASRVWVHGREKLFGTIGALPPHLMSAADRANNYTLDNLHVDIGMSAERAKELVRIGDLVTFDGPARELLNDQFASKTLDDRSCVAILLRAAEMLQKLVCDADVYFVCSSQEEVGGRGAMTSAFAIDPDLSVVLDVDFAETPTCPPRSAVCAAEAQSAAHRLRKKAPCKAERERRKPLHRHGRGRNRLVPRGCAERAAQPAGEVHAHVGGND